jgi:hypothetical protein
LGPFSGRSSDLSSEICGILINPNCDCEFEFNFIPLNTLGQWFQSLTIDNGEQEENVPKFNNYNVEKALERSLIDWLPEFNQINSANHSQENFKVKD